MDIILSRHSPLVIGYSGWEGDVIMSALKRRLQSPLPYNLYWFCYRREDIDSLPKWLKENQQVYFVCPPAQESSRQVVENDEGNSAKKLTKEALPEDIKGFSGKNDDTSTLSAKTVFNKLIQKFDLKAPELTKDPLGFYAKHLRGSLLSEDPEKGDSDIYLIGSVIDRIEQAKITLAKSKEKEQIINYNIESLRDAIRRSQYHQAIKLATIIYNSELSLQQLRELMEAMWSAANELDDNSDEELSSYDLFINIADTLLWEKIEDSTLPERIAKVLNYKGFTLGVLNRNEDAISAYDEVVRVFGDSSETVIKELVAKALNNKGVLLGVLNRDEDAISVYDKVVMQFGDSNEIAIKEMVAIALNNKGIIHGVLNSNEDAISVYKEVIRRFGDSNETALKIQVAKALVEYGFRLGVINRIEDAISAFDEIIRRFGDSNETAIKESVVKGLYNKGVMLGILNRKEDAITVYDEVLRRFCDSKETAIKELVEKAQQNRKNLSSAKKLIF